MGVIEQIRAKAQNRPLMSIIIVRLITTLFVILSLSAAGMYFTLLFADSIDGPSYKQNAEHLKNLMQLEQSNLDAAKETLKHEETP